MDDEVKKRGPTMKVVETRMHRTPGGSYRRREQLHHDLDRLLALAANNLDGFQIALAEARRVAKELEKV